MRGNEISNETAPTIIVVFDDLIGVRRTGPPSGYQTPGGSLMDRMVNRLRKTPPPVAHWDVDPLVAATLMRLFTVGQATIEVVEFCDQIATITDLLDDAHVPYASLQHTHPDHLARNLAYRPDVINVYHPYPAHVMKYGARGRLVTPPFRTMIGMY